MDPRPSEGPIRSQLSARLPVRPSVSSAFFSGVGYYFFLIFYTMLDNWNIFKTDRDFFPGKFIFAQILGKRVINGPQNRFFWILWNILSLVFPRNNLKWKLIFVICISSPILHWVKSWFSSYGPKCCWRIRLQDSLNFLAYR